MVNELANNIFLVNAPAGSGKTTWIRRNVEEHLLQNPDDNILCITYTNRAAEELGRDMDGNNVYFGTIHSFINTFMESFFAHEEIIDLYCEIYEDRILERINNKEHKDNWTETNNKYIEEYGKLDMDTIRSNIEKISYNQTAFNSLYRGSLGHDDLISFARAIVDKFPVVRKKIADKYQVIFIDEYQDTAADVLNIFCSSVIGENSRLYLLGDKMQQIYHNYNGEFEECFKLFNTSIKLDINYRTTPKIVDILNSIYNDEEYKQCPCDKNSNDDMDFSPKVLITTDAENAINDFRANYKDALILYLTNKKRFYNIGAGNLYLAYYNMNKYAFGKKYNAVDILTKDEARINDALLYFLFIVNEINESFAGGDYGNIIRNARGYDNYLETKNFTIRKHADKRIVKKHCEELLGAYNNTSMTVDHFLSICLGNNYIRKEFYNSIVDDDYEHVKNVMIQEIKNLANYLKRPDISTQHGVKGESHNTVVFVAENSKSNPIVNISSFFEIWSEMDINLSEFDSFYYDYNRMLKRIESQVGKKISKWKADAYNNNSSMIDGELQLFRDKNETNQYYIHLLQAAFDKYFGKKKFTNVKECLKDGTVYGPLYAYRLFYVGCSRARRNLLVIINKKDVVGFEDKLCRKLRDTGFVVEQYS